MNERNIDRVEEIDEEENERIARLIEEESQKRANAMATKIFKKNRREIKRLNDHAVAAVLENNFEAYKYAITKLRDIYKQPYNEEIISVNWQTTRKQVWEIINAGTKTV